MMGFSLVPDVFMLLLLSAVLSPTLNDEKHKKIIWIAFLGGLMWDLRWTNLVGLTALLNVFVVFFIPLYWKRVPAQGRNYPLFAFLLFFAQVLTTGANFIFWTIPSQVALRLVLTQLLLVVPVITFLTYLYKKVYEDYV